MKFTFRKEKRQTGLAGIGYPNPSTIINLGGKQVGEIIGPCWNSKGQLWRVRFFVQQSPGHAARWATLSKKFDSEPEARQFVRDRCEEIQAQFILVETE